MDRYKVFPSGELGMSPTGNWTPHADAQATIAALQAVIDDHHRLVREMDVRLNGEQGAAKQASLCDIVSQLVALQARVQELEEITKVICGHCCEPMEIPSKAVLQSALTQRTAELEAAQRKVDLAEKKAWLAAHDVGFFSMWNGTDHSGPPKLALLCNDTFAWATADAEDVLDAQIDTIVELFKSEGEAGVIKWIAQQRNMKPMESVGKWLFGCDAIKKERDDLQAELKRVRDQYADLRKMVLALPKVEGEINERFCTGSYYSSPHDYRSHVTFETALVALLKHRQGMEG